jgi:hypothetical protein
MMPLGKIEGLMNWLINYAIAIVIVAIFSGFFLLIVAVEWLLPLLMVITIIHIFAFMVNVNRNG